MFILGLVRSKEKTKQKKVKIRKFSSTWLKKKKNNCPLIKLLKSKYAYFYYTNMRKKTLKIQEKKIKKLCDINLREKR